MPLIYSQQAILKAKHTAISAQIIHKYALLSLRKPYRLNIAVDCFMAFHVVRNPNPSVKLSLKSDFGFLPDDAAYIRRTPSIMMRW
jgi:hypothetical protein